MQIGTVIRKYRKFKNLTQEEMANRLGVTAPAVNKWENGNSMPDITLLAPIARLLGISLDTLLSFQEELTSEEINSLILEADKRLKSQSYEDTFMWAKSITQQYPNCAELLLQLAIVLDARRLTNEIAEADKYDDYIISCYTRALESDDENTRNRAADSLFGFYSRKEQYDKAEEYLSYFSIQNPERKRKQAQLYSNTGRTDEAYKTFEELLFSYYNQVSMVLSNIYILTMKDNNLEKAHLLVDKMQDLAKLFDMGKYYEVSCQLELATVERNADTVTATMKIMLENLDKITDCRYSPLYEHMEFKELSGEFFEELRQNLLKCFHDEETFDFLKNDKRWEGLVS
jgi:transcriptional regulator with XRE-family HTH domain